MRKLKLQVQMTIDGFISGPNGEMDWMCFNWSEDLIKYVTNLTESMDTILLGKNLATGFIPHWAAVANDPQNPEYEAGKIFNSTPKIVFSRTMVQSEWANTTLAQKEFVTEINELKKQEGKDLIAYGGGQFVSSLIKENLIDELHLFVNPSAIGKGMPIFSEVNYFQKYDLVASQAFECGIVALVYKPK